MSEKNDQETEGLGKAWWASAVVVALVVLGLVTVLVNRSRETDAAPADSATTSTRSSALSGTPGSASASATSTTAATTTSTQPSGPVSEPGWEDKGCHGSPGTSRTPTDALSKVSWQPVGSMSLPTAEELGPGTVEGPLRRCFQHSAAGAVMAASNIFGSLQPTTYEQVLNQQMTPGAGRNETLATTVPADLSGARGQIAGYKLNGCSPTACNVSLAIQGQGVWGQEDLTLVWNDGDWKLNGAYPIPDLGQLPDGLPAGWVAWTP